jgi:response regulator RpfG family c-di-GMP phosphodiesterase
LLIVGGALHHRAMAMEQRRLQGLISQQNAELKELNASLEVKVQARTKDLQLVNDRLKNNFLTSIKVFVSLIEMRQKNLVGHSRRVAELAKKLALQVGLDGKQAQEIFVAALLHEIGKVGFPDELITTPVVMLNTRQLEEFRKYPERAEAALMPLEELKGAVQIITNHLERFDGAGYPRHLSGQSIPIGSRVLSVASDYDALQIGLLAQRKLEPGQAQDVILQGAGRRYDPVVVDALMVLCGALPKGQVRQDRWTEVTTSSLGLRPGMKLSRDLVTPSGLLMLTASHELDEALIKKIIDFERTNGLNLTAEVWQPPTD